MLLKPFQSRNLHRCRSAKSVSTQPKTRWLCVDLENSTRSTHTVTRICQFVAVNRDSNLQCISHTWLLKTEDFMWCWWWTFCFRWCCCSPLTTRPLQWSRSIKQLKMEILKCSTRICTYSYMPSHAKGGLKWFICTDTKMCEFSIRWQKPSVWEQLKSREGKRCLETEVE